MTTGMYVGLQNEADRRKFCFIIVISISSDGANLISLYLLEIEICKSALSDCLKLCYLRSV